MNAAVKDTAPPEPWPDMTPGPVTFIEGPKVPKVYAAIARVMKTIGTTGISKGRTNEQQHYKFRGIDDVYNALSSALVDAGLLMLPRVTKREVTERPTKAGGVLFYTVLDVDYDAVAVEDGSRHTVSVVGEAMDSGDKSSNKAMSAAYKYACMQVFCIPTEGDNDADSKTHEPAAKPVPEDCWTVLGDAAKLGERELRRVWKEQISEETRDVITTVHVQRWETIKAVAAGVDNQKAKEKAA
jgi:hypothetical protein